ncbi:GNAT family N-acetyltransferase [Streptomyces sp. NPDC046332]|uniref:GNAT family N-acetyltransferase n=1 Tax=Streptomyces sp. NPDC046332 TaxID=3155133 RepID=UPI0033E60D9C
MPPADARPGTDTSPDAGADAGTTCPDADPGPGPPTGALTASGTGSEDTLDLHLSDELVALIAAAEGAATTHGDLLDEVATWGPAATPVGTFRLVPVRLERDLTLITRWMNDPAVAAFWELSGPETVTAAHIRAQLDGDGRSVPCLGVLDSTPMSYFEIYRADLDPLARHYPARPHDTGIHLLLGSVGDRGRGVGTVLLRTVADLALDHRPHSTRVIAEPDLRNTPSVSAFLSAGFRFSAEVDLPDKRAALMVRDRALRHVL